MDGDRLAAKGFIGHFTKSATRSRIVIHVADPPRERAKSKEMDWDQFRRAKVGM